MRKKTNLAMSRRFVACCFLLALLTPARLAAVVDPTNGLRFLAFADHVDGIYKPGETIR
jgi:hypothetical protein